MDDGLFRLHLGDETFGPYESVGIIYDVDDRGHVILLKHGGFQQTKIYYDTLKAVVNFATGDYGGCCPAIKLVEICHCNLDDLNHFINTSALPEKYIAKLISGT